MTSNTSDRASAAPAHVHGPDCDYDHDHAGHDHAGHDQSGHVHGPHCNHGHHAPVEQYVRAAPKIGRNDACPCGSDKKYKKCCMAG